MLFSSERASLLARFQSCFVFRRRHYLFFFYFVALVLSGSWGPSFLYGNGDACTAYRCGMNGWEGEMNIHERGSLVRQLLFFFFMYQLDWPVFAFFLTF
jgi:hypothetical protein